MLRRRLMIEQKGGHEYVEIGGIKWATMNIGAESITDYGLYFQWGETNGYTYDQLIAGLFPTGWTNYKFNPSGDGSTFTKYNNTDRKYYLDLEDDAANAAWGGNWRMPTTMEFRELRSATVRTITTIDGVDGVLFTDQVDNSKTLFLPSAGGVEKRYWGNYKSGLMYWLSQCQISEPTAYTAEDMPNTSVDSYAYRASIYTIRAILDE